MKFQLFTLALLAVAANAAESHSAIPAPSAIIPVPPPGVICPMVVCSTSSTLAKRGDEIVCPTYCTDGCKIIDDVCCPGNKKIVCSSGSGSSSGSVSATALVSTAIPTASGTSALSSAVSSAISQVTSSVLSTPVLSTPVLSTPISSATVSPAAASASPSSSGSTKLTVMSSCMLVTLIAIGLNQF